MNAEISLTQAATEAIRKVVGVCAANNASGPETREAIEMALDVIDGMTKAIVTPLKISGGPVYREGSAGVRSPGMGPIVNPDQISRMGGTL